MTIEDEELGKIIIRVNPRAKNLVFRTKSEAIYVSVPPGTEEKEIRKAIENLRGKLTKAREVVPAAQKIGPDYEMNTEYFKLRMHKGNREKFLAHSELGELSVIYPPHADFEDEELQDWLRKVIVEALRRNAKIILPPRLYILSTKYNLPYTSVKINTSKGRWGSCSTKKAINLSSYLILLPQHLIDYVLLHELCHTVEMNHGDKFWKLLNSVTDGKALKLREELRQHQLGIGW